MFLCFLKKDSFEKGLSFSPSLVFSIAWTTRWRNFENEKLYWYQRSLCIALNIPVLIPWVQPICKVCTTYLRLTPNLKINKYQCWIDISVETYIPRPYWYIKFLILQMKSSYIYMMRVTKKCGSYATCWANKFKWHTNVTNITTFHWT